MLLTFLCVLGIACAATATMAAENGGTVSDGAFKKRVTHTIAEKYLLFLPKGYKDSGEKRWPLIVFLHGSGERGDDVQRVKIHGPIKVAEKDPDFPFVIVAPQCPEDKWWNPDMVIAVVDEIQKKYRVDVDRTYLTGLSMGGFGTWETATEYPGRFAAIAPICGRGNAFMAWRLKDLPIWVFHGQKDTCVPFSNSEDMVSALKELGADVKFTVYPEAGHDSWTETYNNPELYRWFLSHRRGEKRQAGK